MLLVDTKAGRVISDEELKERFALKQSYGEWLDQYLIDLKDLPIPNKKVEKNSGRKRQALQSLRIHIRGR